MVIHKISRIIILLITLGFAIIFSSEPALADDKIINQLTNTDARIKTDMYTSPIPEDNIETTKLTGYWRVARSDRNKGLGHLYFAYDGNSVTIWLFSEKDFMWKSYDEHYKLKCRLIDSELQYLPPFGTWQTLAMFEGGQFYIDRNNQRIDYKKFTRQEALGNEGALLAPRKLHDYSVKPIDQPKWRTNKADYLFRWPGLYQRENNTILDAFGVDVMVARQYPFWEEKGEIIEGYRLSIKTEKTNYSVGETVRVIHVMEVVEPGLEVFVMGPKSIYGEFLDNIIQGEKPATPDYPWMGMYDGAVLKSPDLDYNFEVTTYNFTKPGVHKIVWMPGSLISNTLTISVK